VYGWTKRQEIPSILREVIVVVASKLFASLKLAESGKFTMDSLVSLSYQTSTHWQSHATTAM